MTGGGRGTVLAAVTGGIGCGKSEVGRVLAAHGAAVLDADEVARTVTAPGGEAWAAVAEAFGRDVLRPDGTLRRKRLGERVFADPGELDRLNRIVHPPVIARCRAWGAQRRDEGRDAAVLVPLLFEAGLREGWSAVVCVSAAPETVRRRLRERGLDERQIAAREAAQWPLAEKERQSDYVIRNDGSMAELEAKTLAVWRLIVEKEQEHHV